MVAGERQTQRLLARKPTPDDRTFYHVHFTQPVVEAWLRPPPRPPFNAQVLDELVEGDCVHWQDHGFGPWILVEKESGAFAGRGGLAWTSVEGTAAVELPWSIEPHFHGNGLATEAAGAAVDWARELDFEQVIAHGPPPGAAVAAVAWARELDFEPVIALVLPTNTAPQRVAEKAGFEQDGEVVHAGLPHLLSRLPLA